MSAQHVAQVNAVFDELWAERNAQIAKLPAMFQGLAEGFSTRDQVLATAYKVVAAVDKANALFIPSHPPPLDH